MYKPLKNNESTIVTILVTNNVSKNTIDYIIKNTEHKLVGTTAGDLADTLATMKSAKLSIAQVAFDFTSSTDNVVKTCMYNKVEIKDTSSQVEIKRREQGVLSDSLLLADIYNNFATDSNLQIVANAVRSLIPVHYSFEQAIAFLADITNVHADIAEQKLDASIKLIRSIVNSTTNLYNSIKLATKEEMYVKVFNRAEEDVDTIELVKAQTGAEKTIQAQRLCRFAHRKGIKTCSITTLRNVVEQNAPEKAKTVIAHKEESLAAFEQAEHFSCTMHSLLSAPM
ncbi:hypothetical protein [Vibrio harveyi]|uniref:hypothetical protein n=2 Tax=Vibrio harveyi TaxID=669 RepID=UPI0007524001|nr:hypothetical protein [Vibrio harveyi]PNM41310.1 hypothetical protein AL469_014600 [Vibrio harveyi]